MKKQISIILVIILLLTIFSSCDKSTTESPHTSQANYTESELSNLPKDATLIDVTFDKSISLEGSIDEVANFSECEEIKAEITDEVWFVNGKAYYSNRTVQPGFNKVAYWKVDLSYLVPCGKTDKVLFYSSDGKYDNDILIADYANTLYFLSSGNVLDPHQYSFDDFTAECLRDDYRSLDGVSFEALWKSHLENAGVETFPATSTGFSSASSNPPARYRLNNSPELIYILPYRYVGNNEYLHFGPFEPTIAE